MSTPVEGAGNPPSRPGESLLRKYATSATTATFAVVAVTGVLVFFHVGDNYVKGLHEWLGIAFVAAALLHVARHFKSFTALLRQRRTQVMLGLAALVAAGFIASAAMQPEGGGSPVRQAFQMVVTAPISSLAPLVGKTPEALTAALKAGGLENAAPDQTLGGLARQAGRPLPEVLRIVMTKGDPAQQP